MADDLKSSAAVWGGKDKGADDSPPAYAANQADDEDGAEPESNPPVLPQRRPVHRTTYDPLRRFTVLATVPYHKYNVPDGSLSADRISLTVKHSDLYSQPQHLLPFILEQGLLPPKPILRIIGTHCGSRPDFDIQLNLSHLLNLKNYKWHFRSAQVNPIQGRPSTLYDRSDAQVTTLLAGTVKQFCRDQSENKSYTLVRRIDGLPTEMLAGQVRNLAHSIKYRGALQIDFVDERSRVVVHKQPSSWFSSLLRLHSEKKFEMAETVWDLSDPFGDEDGVNSADVGLRSAQEWWQSWQSTIRNAMIAKHQGNIGIEDWIETRMGKVEPEPRIEWGRDHQM